MEAEHGSLKAFEEEAKQLDADTLSASSRSHFYLPENRVYLDGNSLGLLSREAEASLIEALQAWKQHQVLGWTEGKAPWFFLAENLGTALARIMGAQPEEVVAANSTTVNLHQLLATLYNPKLPAKNILCDASAFPSDIYALQSSLHLRGANAQHLQMIHPGADGLLHEEEIAARMDSSVQLVLLPSVVYTTGQLLDMKRLAQHAARHSILIGFDCSHSAGVVEHQLHDWGVDFAFWCTYKYLNGGPGASAALFLHNKHHGVLPGMAGWFSSEKTRQFDMAHTLAPAAGAGALQIGTPNILSMAPLSGALSLIEQAGIGAIRARSLALTDYLIRMAHTVLAPYDVAVATPLQQERRGGHVALRHPQARQLCLLLREQGILPDHRPPDIIRLAPAPLYNSFHDCFTALQKLHALLASGAITGCTSAALIP